MKSENRRLKSERILLYSNFLSRSDMRILASHKVAGTAIWEPCPERTLEKLIVSTVLSGRDVIPEFPATAWLANLRRRFATKRMVSKKRKKLENRNPSRRVILHTNFPVRISTFEFRISPPLISSSDN